VRNVPGDPAGTTPMTDRAGEPRGARAERFPPHPACAPHPELPVSARELLESVPDAIVCVDAEGRIAFVNLRAEEMFGYDRTEMVGQRLELLLPDRLAEAHAQHRAGYHANPTARPMDTGLDLLARRKDGTEFPVEVSLSPLSTAGGLQAVSAVRDVTQRRQGERERERLLEDAGRARDAAEQALRNHAEAERLKDDLANMIVHDLKNPVHGIAMTAQMLLRKGQLSETQRTSVGRIARACHELLRLIGNVLEIARIEAGALPVRTERIALAELIDEIAADYGPVADDEGGHIRIAVGTGLPPAAADRTLLRRVLVNLIVNAFRHSGSREVRIEAASEPAGSHVAIRVVDHGHGIPEADQAGIFEKFGTRCRDTTADTGLGLPFCKLAVESMQGHIALSSAPGTGTTFTVTLPCASC
jgi:PAS domain S-box-containing protein